ncbi:MAG: DUF1682 domain-containing protein [Phycisphaerae bacterium]|nr:DUF1682 domain-containing protein [Phycisphaerae bacterium]
MKSKKGLSIEQHVDKIAIGISALVSLWLLWAFVLSNPYGQELKPGRGKVPPSRIDSEIEQSAKRLEERLNTPPDPVVLSLSSTEAYHKTFKDPLESIPFFMIPLPGSGLATKEDRRIYRLPEIPEVTGVAADSIRTVVYRPIEEVDRDLPYGQVQTELGDMDLVTVQGTVDIPKMIQAFRTSFAHPRIRADWIDEKLASPVFAGVGLERRQQNEDGSWSEWGRVGPTKINAYKTLMQIPETTRELDLNLSVKMDLMRPIDIQKAILQPAPYDIASPKERWLAPSYHIEYRKLRTKEEEQISREEREQKQEAMQQARDQQKNNRTPADPTRGRTTQQRQPQRQTRDDRMMNNPGRRTGTGRMGMDDPYMTGGDPSRLTTGPRAKPERTSEDVVRDFEKKRLGDRLDWSKLTEPAVFWAHDDSLPGPGVYQYRIRIGVFNPVAGKNWTAEDQKDLNERVILWSPYSEASDLIRIEPMYYFFPQKYLAEQDKLEVKVAKFHLGQWRSEPFQVSRGEMIGGVVDNPFVMTEGMDPGMRGMNRDTMMRRGGMGGGMEDPLMSLPQTIDYTTGAIMVDIASATQWGGSMLTRQEYQEMLYSMNGSDLRHLALGEGFWRPEIREKYNLIKKVEKDPPLLFLGRGQVSSSPLRTPPPTRDWLGPGGPGMERDASMIRRTP